MQAFENSVENSRNLADGLLSVILFVALKQILLKYCLLVSPLQIEIGTIHSILKLKWFA